ncbi:hypothetical protein SynRS9907_00853 [Synechococcus sp. RS9907]|nr:hypothetical protein SynRS9907_00853 [Synechococcus sp. RS9907]
MLVASIDKNLCNISIFLIGREFKDYLVSSTVYDATISSIFIP